MGQVQGDLIKHIDEAIAMENVLIGLAEIGAAAATVPDPDRRRSGRRAVTAA